MLKFSQFYVTYRNIVQFDLYLGKLDYFEKSVLKLMADPVVSYKFVRPFVRPATKFQEDNRITATAIGSTYGLKLPY